MRSKLLTAAVLTAAASVASWSCNIILGVEDAEPDPLLHLPVENTVSPLCMEYCDVVMDACDSVYPTRPACEAVCSVLPTGSEGVSEENTVQCRLKNAQEAAAEPLTECPVAGPTGQLGADEICGSHCEAYCTLFETACPPHFAAQGYQDLADCIDKCAPPSIPALADGYTTDLVTGDSIQCRIYHVTVALLDPSQHCPHASGESPCVSAAGGSGGGSAGAGGAAGGSGGAGGGTAGAGG